MKLTHLERTYGGQKVLEDFSLDLPDKGCLCLFGPSGCGKTTLLWAVCETLWKAGRRTAFAFQEDRLLPWLSAEENVRAVGAGREKARALLCLMGLSGAEQKRPPELSGGMRRRVALARALAYGGDVLLLDEPFQGLDETSRKQAIEAVRAHCPPVTLLVTHDRKEAEALSDRILFLEGPPLRVVREELR